MNYLQLINKCLVELNYKQVNAFSELTKNDHKKIKNIINLINTEVCRYDRWNFLLRKATLNLPRNTGEIENPVTGRIETIFVNGIKYKFHEKFEDFLSNTQPDRTYSSFDDKLLFPIFNENKTLDIIYYTPNNAKNSNNEEKLYLENDTDTSLVPDPYIEPIIVYGTCMRLKANPQHIKFNYWLSMYKEALSNLRARNCISMDYSPNVKLFRY